MRQAGAQGVTRPGIDERVGADTVILSGQPAWHRSLEKDEPLDVAYQYQTAPNCCGRANARNQRGRHRSGLCLAPLLLPRLPHRPRVGGPSAARDGRRRAGQLRRPAQDVHPDPVVTATPPPPIRVVLGLLRRARTIGPAPGCPGRRRPPRAPRTLTSTPNTGRPRQRRGRRLPVSMRVGADEVTVTTETTEVTERKVSCPNGG